MTVSRTEILEIAAGTGFHPVMLEKVVRLIGLLNLLNTHLWWTPETGQRGKTALKLETEVDTAWHDSEEVLRLMRRVDEIHTAHITWGSRKIRDALRLEGYVVNRERVQRLMRRKARSVRGGV